MPGLLDEMRDVSARRHPKCTMGRLLSALTPEDQKAVEAALADPDVTAEAIAAVLTRNDTLPSIRGGTVARHRRGRCSCEQED